MKTVRGVTMMERVTWLQNNRHLMWDGLPLALENYDFPHDRLLMKVFNTMKEAGLYGRCMHVTTANLHSVITLARKLNAVVQRDTEVKLRYTNVQDT